jgi:hypothetical protein
MGARVGFVAFATITMLGLAASNANAQTAPRELIVHLDAAPGVTLEREDGDDDWTEVCFAPCDLPFVIGPHYRVGGGIRDSMPFTLHETSPGLEVIVVEPRSRGVHAFGDVLIGVGSAMTFIALFTAAIGGLVQESCEGGETRDLCSGGQYVVPSLVVALVGVVVIVAGVDLVIVNRASFAHPERHANQPIENGNRAQILRFDLSQRRDDSRASPSLSGAVPIFTYRF